MTQGPGVVGNVTIELAVLKNPHYDPKNMFLALLEVILVQDSSYSFGLKLETPRPRRSRPCLKQSIVKADGAVGKMVL